MTQSGMMEDELHDALIAAFAKSKSNCTAFADRSAGVLILRDDHLRGIWFWRNRCFEFVPGGYTAATKTANSAEEAVVYTLQHICK